MWVMINNLRRCKPFCKAVKNDGNIYAGAANAGFPGTNFQDNYPIALTYPSPRLSKLVRIYFFYGLTNSEASKTKRKVRMFYLVYGDEHNKALEGALDEFNAKMQRH
jgi:hypothetical protein